MTDADAVLAWYLGCGFVLTFKQFLRNGANIDRHDFGRAGAYILLWGPMLVLWTSLALTENE